MSYDVYCVYFVLGPPRFRQIYMSLSSTLIKNGLYAIGPDANGMEITNCTRNLYDNDKQQSKELAFGLIRARYF